MRIDHVGTAVLLVDPRPFDAYLLRSMLEGMPAEPMRVTVAETLEAGLGRLAARHFDLVLVDPTLRGTTPEHAVRALVEAANPAPVVVLSHRPDVELEARYLRLGAQDVVLVGDVAPADLDRRLRHAVARQLKVLELLEARRRAEHLAAHDALTGLPGRVLFEERASQALSGASRYGRCLAVLFVDLDGFKQVNDAHGHAAGDLLLRGVARRLAASVRASDTAARFGGDEFVILLDHLEGAQDAERVAASLVERLSRPYALQRGPVEVTVSVGVACFPTDGRSVATLLRKADTAMYAAKRAGRSRHRAWRPELAGAAPRRTYTVTRYGRRRPPIRAGASAPAPGR